jgi:S-adenosylmethionine-diacylglycerol 3-amino-3-carboxypropyl transferase
MSSEVSQKADFSIIRYAQCWEDADILIDALNIRPNHSCVAIGSAGDNALAMLSQGPERLIALDISPAQIACLELRVAAYKELEHGELLELIGSTPSSRRFSLYRRCRPLLSVDTRQFWDGRSNDIELGIGNIGKLENYFRFFRTRVMPLIHPFARINRLFELNDIQDRKYFYRNAWDNRRWRLSFKAFFSRFLLGCFGRDPNFFNYVDGDVSKRFLERAHYGMTALDPSKNPYLQWIFFGCHKTALPCALRPENFEKIQKNIDKLEWRLQSVEDFLATPDAASIDRYNLSDIFEYMSLDNYHQLLERLIACGRSGTRLAYWNLLVPRQRPDYLADQLNSLSSRADELHLRDKTFFYSAFILEEIV